MKLHLLSPEEYEKLNEFATHPLQSNEWGKFREKTGLRVLRFGVYDTDQLIDTLQMTLHPIPKTNLFIGYLPKSHPPTKEIIEELKRIGKEYRCVFIQLEPLDIATVYSSEEIKQHTLPKDTSGHTKRYTSLGLIPSAHPLFTKYTFSLDLTKPEEELLKNMHAKARYNIKVATKHNVVIKEDNSEKAFESYLHLTHETTERQKFYAHTDSYHKMQWQVLPHHANSNHLSSHLLLATYEKETLVSWIVFLFKDTLYYPYGASSSKFKEVMASNLMMWEAIRFGKKNGMKKFDMWGALGLNADKKDPWYGFHNFKERYGGDLIEYVGSYDLVINPIFYQGYRMANKLRWLLLRLL